MAGLQRPPIPQVPIADQNGNVTQEWRHWFMLLGVFGNNLSTSVAAISNKTVDVETQGGLTVAFPEDAVSADPAVRAALMLQRPQDAPPDLLTLVALLRPQDPIIAGTYLSSFVPKASAVSLTSGTNADITSLSLGPGDWDVEGVVQFNPAGTTVIMGVGSWVSATSATLPSDIFSGYQFTKATFAAGQNVALATGRKRFSLTATTTVYLSTQATFTTSTMSANGELIASRLPR